MARCADVRTAALPSCVPLYWWPEVGGPGMKGWLGCGPVKAQSQVRVNLGPLVTLGKGMGRQEEAEVGNLQVLYEPIQQAYLPPNSGFLHAAALKR